MNDDWIHKLITEVGELKLAVLNRRNAKEWLSIEEASDYLGMSVNTLYKYVSENKIPFKKIPGSNLVRFHKRALDVWIETGKKLS